VLAGAGRYHDAPAKVAAAELDDRARAAFDVDFHEARLASADRQRGSEREIRRALERSLRRLADLTPEATERFALVDRANRARPVTLL
jgi:hypothetical protein